MCYLILLVAPSFDSIVAAVLANGFGVSLGDVIVDLCFGGSVHSVYCSSLLFNWVRQLIFRFQLDLYLLTLFSFSGVDLLVSFLTCYGFLWQWKIGFHSTFIGVPC